MFITTRGRIEAMNHKDGLCECGCGETTTVYRGEFRRFVIGHNQRWQGPEYRIDERGCWIWLRSTDGCGYGLVKIDGRTRRAHRVLFEQLRRPIPSGLQLDHLCRNRRCVNPDHLDLVTQRINTLRGEAPAAANARMTACRRGHEFDEANTHYETDKGGRVHRRCRACRSLRARQQRNESI